MSARRGILSGTVCLALSLAPVIGREELALGVEDAVQRALERGLDLQIERINPLIARERILEAKGEFGPSLGFSGTYKNNKRFSNSVLEIAAVDGRIREEIYTPQATLSGKFALGTEYNFSVSAPILKSDNPLRLFDESYTPTANLGFVQPLINGFGPGVNKVRIRQAESSERESLLALKAKMLTVIRDVEIKYWAVSYAQRHVEVTQGSLDVATDLVERLSRMHGAGLATTLDLSKAQLAAAERKADLARARADLLNAQTLLRSVIDPGLPASTSIIARDTPPDDGPPADLQEKLDLAVATRPEIAQQTAAIERLQMEERLARSNSLWRLDAQAGASFNGLAGKEVGPLIVSPLPAGLDERDDYWEAFDDGNMSWAVGLSLEIPLGNRSALAELEPTRLRLRQEEIRLSLIKAQIGVELQVAFQDMTAEWMRLTAAHEAVEIARRQLDAEERSMGAGLTTVSRVLDAQDDLARAQDTETLALVSYASARARLVAAQGAGLETYRLELEP